MTGPAARARAGGGPAADAVVGAAPSSSPWHAALVIEAAWLLFLAWMAWRGG